jgi:hypothetical protein
MCHHFHGPDIVTVLFVQVLSVMCVCGVLGAHGTNDLATTLIYR